METVVIIDKVFTASGSNSKGLWTRYDVKTANGLKFQTFDDGLGQTARGLEKREVKIDYEAQERSYTDKNGFPQTSTNNVIKSISPVGEQTGNVVGDTILSVTKPASQGASQDEFRRPKEEMRRSEAVNAAAIILASPNFPEEFSIDNLAALAGEIAKLLETGTVEEPVGDVRF